MKRVKRLVIATVLIVIMVIICRLINIDNIASIWAGTAGGGTLYIYESDYTWYSGKNAMTANGKGWGPYYEGIGEQTFFWKGEDNGQLYFGFDAESFRYQNVYCAQKDKLIECPVLWTQIQWSVDIVGDTAIFYRHDTATGERLETPFNVSTNGFNNQFAYLLNKSPSGNYGAYTGTRFIVTDVQYGIWAILNDWLEACNMKDEGYYSGNDTSYKESIYKDMDVNETYTATFYYFDVKFGETNNEESLSAVYGAQGTDWPDGQNIIVIEKRKKIITIPMNITVTKVWEDYGNAYKNRPSEIGVDLYLNNYYVSSMTLKPDTWSGTFSGLTRTSTYAISEPTVPTGYYPEITGDASTGFTITNKLITTSISVTKKWLDNENSYGARKDVTVTLYETIDGTKSVSKDENGKDRTITLGTEDSSTKTFTNLPTHRNGKTITYTVEEDVPDGYMNEITGDATNGFTITNIYVAGYTEITGKVWLDGKAGKDNNINGTYGNEDKDRNFEENEIIKIRLKDKSGNAIKASYYKGSGDNIEYCGTEYAETASDGTYTIRVNYDNRYNVYRLHTDPAKIELQNAYVEFEYDGQKYTTVQTGTTGANTSKAKENEKQRNSFDSAHSTVTASPETPDAWKDKRITATTKGVISFGEYTDTTKTKQTKVIKICNGNGTYTSTNPDYAWGDLITKRNTKCNHSNTGNVNFRHTIGEFDVDVTTIQNVNLGLFGREDPDVAIFSDLTKVEVEMNNQQYTYLYNVRSNSMDSNDENYIKAKFQNKDTYTYRRPVNPADIAYLEKQGNNNSDETMKVFVTYEVKVGNKSSTLPITVNSIINAYDSNYNIISIVKGKDENTAIPINYKESATYNTSDKFNEITLSNLNITVGYLNESSDTNTIVIKYEVNPEKIITLFNDEAPINNVVEIESYSTIYGEKTLYAEQRTHEKDESDDKSDTKGRAGKAYAGYDYNSHPGNAGIYINNAGRLQAAKAEDDTDIAPSFVLCKDEEKTLAGTIWEDTDDEQNDDERLGDGKYGLNNKTNKQEESVQNVKIELYEIIRDAETGEVTTKLATLYKKDGKTEEAETYSDENGNYRLEGVVTGEYFIKFTYGNALENATTMDEGTTTVNARNHKSTIITDPKIQEVFSKNYGDSDYDEKWHITHDDGYSVAVDNMIDRLEIEDLQYSNYEASLNMTAFTKPFKTQVEFESTGDSQVTATEKERDDKMIEGDIEDDAGEEITNVLNRLDFGIAERPREDLYIQKTITNFRITLANGQVLTEGNPTDENGNINYAKAIGFGQEFNSGEAARNVLEKQLLIEIDAELIQGAQLEVQYEIKVTNNNEIDYDYETDYTDIVAGDTVGQFDKYITKNSKANYYYYGKDTDNNGNKLDEMQATIEFVDYMDKDIVYKDNGQWTNIDVDDLHVYGDELISDDAHESASNNQYEVLGTASGASMTIARGKTTDPLQVLANKVLANNDENVFDNNVEILKIDGKTARTIQESTGGEQVEKTYKPGNYVPNLNGGTFEQDDDRVKIIITPPTGETNYIITYAIVGLVGLIVMVIGIIFIKKKI